MCGCWPGPCTNFVARLFELDVVLLWGVGKRTQCTSSVKKCFKLAELHFVVSSPVFPPRAGKMLTRQVPLPPCFPRGNRDRKKRRKAQNRSVRTQHFRDREPILPPPPEFRVRHVGYLTPNTEKRGTQHLESEKHRAILGKTLLAGSQQPYHAKACPPEQLGTHRYPSTHIIGERTTSEKPSN